MSILSEKKISFLVNLSKFLSFFYTEYIGVKLGPGGIYFLISLLLCCGSYEVYPNIISLGLIIVLYLIVILGPFSQLITRKLSRGLGLKHFIFKPMNFIYSYYYLKNANKKAQLNQNFYDTHLSHARIKLPEGVSVDDCIDQTLLEIFVK